MRATLAVILLLLGLIPACDSRKSSSLAPASAGRSTNSLPPDRVAALVRSLVQAQLPPAATNVYGTTKSVFTTVVDVRFECSTGELHTFLAASPVLQDELIVGKRAVVDTMSAHAWWLPDALASVSGSEQSWRTTNGTVTALLMSGGTGAPGRVTVYLSVTIE